MKKGEFRYFKFCLKCGGKFSPIGRFTKLCPDCNNSSSNKKKVNTDGKLESNLRIR